LTEPDIPRYEIQGDIPTYEIQGAVIVVFLQLPV